MKATIEVSIVDSDGETIRSWESDGLVTPSGENVSIALPPGFGWNKDWPKQEGFYWIFYIARVGPRVALGHISHTDIDINLKRCEPETYVDVEWVNGDGCTMPVGGFMYFGPLLCPEPPDVPEDWVLPDVPEGALVWDPMHPVNANKRNPVGGVE